MIDGVFWGRKMSKIEFKPKDGEKGNKKEILYSSDHPVDKLKGNKIYPFWWVDDPLLAL